MKWKKLHGSSHLKCAIKRFFSTYILGVCYQLSVIHQEKYGEGFLFLDLYLHITIIYILVILILSKQFEMKILVISTTI